MPAVSRRARRITGGSTQTAALAGALAARTTYRWAADLAPVLCDLRDQGVKSPEELAAALNRRGITAGGGESWSPLEVVGLLLMLEVLPRRQEASSGIL
jgi:hypothetical protein